MNDDGVLVVVECVKGLHGLAKTTINKAWNCSTDIFILIHIISLRDVIIVHACSVRIMSGDYDDVINKWSGAGLLGVTSIALTSFPDYSR